MWGRLTNLRPISKSAFTRLYARVLYRPQERKTNVSCDGNQGIRGRSKPLQQSKTLRIPIENTFGAGTTRPGSSSPCVSGRPITNRPQDAILPHIGRQVFIPIGFGGPKAHSNRPEGLSHMLLF
jgi:hypothetical protein